MWLKNVSAPFVSICGKKFIVIDYSKISYFKETDTYGGGKPLVIKDEIKKIKDIYEKNFKNIELKTPEKDELIVINVKKPYKDFYVIKEDGVEYQYEDIDAFVDVKQGYKDRIILPYPLYSRTAKQAIHHEVGHWFFDRLGDKLAEKYNYKHRDGIIIDEEEELGNGRVIKKEITSFDDCTEMAAYYCEEYFNKPYNRTTHQDKKLLNELDGIKKKYSKPLDGIYTELKQEIIKNKIQINPKYRK